MGQCNFKKHFKSHSFSEKFNCDMTRLRNTTLDVFIRVHKNHFKRHKYGTDFV